MRRFRNNDDEEVLVNGDADWALDLGWEELEVTPYSEPSAGESAQTESTTPEPNGNGGDVDLSKLKMPELIVHAEKIGIAGDALDALKKPGMSKAKAIEAIEAHLAAGNK